jgi:signal transduction histidine kinase/CheY-like chemotaxis protein
MIRIQGSSIVERLTRMNLLVSGMALFIACASFIGYDAVTFRAATVRDLSIRAQVIGANSVSALLFNDADYAAKTLSALQTDPHVLSAATYTMDGALFAHFQRTPGDRVPPFPRILPAQLESHTVQGSEIVVAHMIESDGRPIGIVCIRSDVQALYDRLLLYAGVGALVMLASLLTSLALAVVFHKAVARPIVHLAETAKTVSHDRRFSLRVPPVPGHGEVSVLIDAFNEMMGQIEGSEEDLRRAHDELELRVEERTAELVAAKRELEEYSSSILRAKEEVERSSKFKDQFLSTMSHELRTPLNAVLGFSEMLTAERYGPLNDRQRRYVSHIHTGGTHLLRLINDILDISKIEAGRLQLTLETVPVNATFAEVADALQPLLDKRSQLLTQDCSPHLSVLADGVRFRQILMNLLGNAIKFTPDGGRIALKGRRQGNLIRVEVRDSGPGIPPEEQERIFEAFHRLRQVDKAAEGTGLGLAITRSLVELHGGKLGLESTLGAGCCFYFTLPAAISIVPTPVHHSDVDSGVRNPGRILVIDDDHAGAQLLESQLSSVGYDVVLCEQPTRAVEMAATLQPAAITLDIVMKPVNGWEVLSNLKDDARTREIPVVVVTILDQKSTGASLGADEYIVKPVERATLLDAVERCLRHPRQERAPHSILVIEDDPPTREFIAEVLGRQGYVVTVAADGSQARVHLHTALPDAVVLDLILPDISGLQLLAEWRADPRTADLPVLVLTSKDLAPDEKNYLHHHAEAFFSKQDAWEGSLIRSIERAAPLPAPEQAR